MTARTLLTAAVLCFVVASPAFAHDPKEHEKEAAAAKAKPDCAKLKTMDMSKTDPNDPVMKALHAKCDKPKGTQADHDHEHDPAKDEKKDPADTDGHGGH